MTECLAADDEDQDYVVLMAQELIRIPAENPPRDSTDDAEKILVEL